METTTDTVSTVMPLDKAIFHLQKKKKIYSHHHWLFIFISDDQEPEIVTQLLLILKCITVLTLTVWSPKMYC